MSTYLLRMILPIRKTKILRSPLISTRKTRAKWAWKAFTQLRYCFSAEIISVLISSRAPVFGRKSLVFLRSWSAAKKSSQHSNASFREIRISESKMYSEKRTFRSLAILPSHSAFASVGSSEVELFFNSHAFWVRVPVWEIESLTVSNRAAAKIGSDPVWGFTGERNEIG